MYQMSYAETLEDSAVDKRSQEREVFTLAIKQLEEARDNGPTSDESYKALTTIRQLWSFLIDDLGSDDNALPTDLRAELISIGIFCIKQADKIRAGESEDFASLIQINETIRDGLN
ncbi:MULTISPECIES: flagellar biosynthesis regulator FlaF [Pseudovibrio]|uniref:flagellar biosynthesis regulator FlaF n=1 Tax=Stappiaceae TaxID=2821832 RepID=UPI002365A36B|nr:MULTISPECIES: flagellar biosynthesis regulator FlaF [Pseudovibrio]MDD7909000.1 flagellar biosynthesis regulator FlaF [Pseudovibrio exalbescens]MDX5593679.1 flagellar biosynthesis regulator FlaF [Pseudovibrio sp. SPO723]